MRCPSCGTDVDGQANFCTECGNALQRVPEAAPGSVDAADDTPTDPGIGGEAPTDPGHRPAPVVAEEHTTSIGPVDGGEAGLRTCPACGSPNSARRMLCGRCGAPLADEGIGDDVTPPPRPAAAPAPRRGTSRPPVRRDPRRVARRRRLTVVAVVVVGVLAGATIGAMAGLHRGPFAVAPGPPDAPGFDPGAYAPSSSPVTIASLRTATTHPPMGDRQYAPSLMLDGDLTTAWNNDGSTHPQGAGETITITLDRPAWVDGIRLANGAQADDASYHGNARIRRARLTFDGGETVTVRFLDQQGWQQLTLDHPRLTTALRIEVLDGYAGDTYDDLAVSEIAVVGWDAMGEDARIAEERAAVAPADASGPGAAPATSRRRAG